MPNVGLELTTQRSRVTASPTELARRPQTLLSNDLFLATLYLRQPESLKRWVERRILIFSSETLDWAC